MRETEVGRAIDYYEFDGLKKDITDMKSLMSRMVEAMGRITIIEERQHAASEVSNRTLERMEQIADKQHASEVTNAGNLSVLKRVSEIENTFLELHVEGERNKARFATFTWLVHALWAVVGSSGMFWLFKSLTTAAQAVPLIH